MMSVDTESQLDIRIGQVIWPKSWEGPRSDQQLRSLTQLVKEAGDGVIVDCSLVEVGTSEIVTLLMRIRNQAKQMDKQFVLFSVPETLADLIRICNLRSILPTAEDAVAAKKFVFDRSRVQGNWRDWLKSHSPWR